MGYVLHHLSSRFTTGGQHEDEKGEKRREKGGTQGTGRQRETEAGKRGRSGEKGNLVLCRVESELLLSPLPCISNKTGD